MGLGVDFYFFSSITYKLFLISDELNQVMSRWILRTFYSYTKAQAFIPLKK